MRPGTEWCQQAITPRYPNFHFHAADLYNRHYNPTGRVSASEYRFPFGDRSFDFVVLTSVFTHLLPPARDNYFSEIARVLRPAGRCLATFFLLDAAALQRVHAGRDAVGFRFQGPGYWTNNQRIPEAAIAYEEANVPGGVRTTEPRDQSHPVRRLVGPRGRNRVARHRGSSTYPR